MPGLKPVKERRRRRGDEVPLAAEADAFRHQAARGHERQRLRPLVLSEGRELVCQRTQPLIGNHAPHGQLRPGCQRQVFLREVPRHRIALPVIRYDPSDLRAWRRSSAVDVVLNR